MNTLPNKATTLREIRQVCTPKPLVGDTLDAFFVETDESRDPYQNTRKLLHEVFEDTPDARVLFVGHRGCGKSTELNKFLAESGDRFFPVTFSVMDEMSAVAVQAEDLVLVITERVLRTAIEKGIDVDVAQLQQVEQYFDDVTKKTIESRDMQLTCGAGANTSGSLLGKLVGLYAKITAEIKLDAHSEETVVSKLRKRPSDLLAQANCVIQAVQQALPNGQRLLIIVEDLDKLDLKRAREIFVENTNLLIGISANIIYTIPIFIFHSPDAGAFIHKFDRDIGLPMIKVYEPGAATQPEGFATVRRIITLRIEPSLITEAAIDLLIEKTGGVLRQAFQVLETASRIPSASTPLDVMHIQYGLTQLRKEYWRQISLPYNPMENGPDSVEKLYNRLEEYAKKQNTGEKNPPITDPINQLLLQSAALVEYNGDGWFGVHPLVIDNLKELGRIL